MIEQFLANSTLAVFVLISVWSLMQNHKHFENKLLAGTILAVKIIVGVAACAGALSAIAWAFSVVAS
jgi:hypothetical protein